MQPLIKILLSALLIYGITELAKRSSVIGAVTASLPLISILAMIWLWHDTHDVVRVARLSHGIFWLVLPSLVLFVLLPPPFAALAPRFRRGPWDCLGCHHRLLFRAVRSAQLATHQNLRGILEGFAI